MLKLNVKYYFFFIIILSLSVKCAAQNEPTAHTKYRNTKVYSEDLVIDGVKLDKRIAKYYSEDDLFAMNGKKINQLNYLYLKSFKVLNYDDLDKTVKKFIDESFDIGDFENKRKHDESAVIEITIDNKKFSVELFSQVEVQKTKENIQ